MEKELHISYQVESKKAETIKIPGSKSESNRALLINALCKNPGKINNLSTARDTQLMETLIVSKENKINVLDAGTVMRFLTTYFSLTNQQKTITGVVRMQERPIKLLVDALKTLGVSIDYQKKEGYPPLKINEFSNQKATIIHIDGSISSQYLSALLMLAPTLPKGLTLYIQNGATSKPYLQMTIELMEHFGVKTQIKGNKYQVKPSNYCFKPFTVEPDWSSASYWYSIFVLSKKEKLTLLGYRKNSFQGDRILVELMEYFGVKTTFTSDGATLRKQKTQLPKQIDFINTPDLAQTFAVLCAALEHTCIFTGLHTLKIKETNRIIAIQQELKKIGANFIETDKKWTVLPPPKNWKNNPVLINTYHDHRMAMAFAPLACVLPHIKMESPQVVNKSYPSFWSDLASVGFNFNP